MAEGLRTDYSSYVMALRCIEKARFAFDDAMLCFDFIITPSAPGGAPNGLQETGSPRFNMVWTWLHAPVITLPMTTDQRGLPLGLQLTGRRHKDDSLLSFAETVFHKTSFEL
jgi:amidase